ncbi:MAG: alpha/beta hydrolase [Spirosomataceae bacterium]
MNPQPVYFLSGLGADERAFQALRLPDVSMHHVRWLKPQPRERIEQYALRLLEQIPTPKPILVGLSFGGMLSVEIAKQVPVQKIIQISSARTHHAIPKFYKAGRYFPIYRWVPIKSYLRYSPLAYKRVGARLPQDIATLKQVFMEADEDFYKWAIHQIVHWRNEVVLPNLVQIHGTRDQLLPDFSTAKYVVEDGTHYMVRDRAAEISAILMKEIGINPSHPTA